MNDDTIQRLRDAYARRILEDLAGLGSLASSDYIRFHALKLLGQHYGLEHVINQLLFLSRCTKSDWLRLQISTLVGTYLQLFTSFAEHENTPYCPAPWPEDPPPPPPLPPEFERELLTGTPFPDEQPPDQPPTPTSSTAPTPNPPHPPPNSVTPTPNPPHPTLNSVTPTPNLRHSRPRAGIPPTTRAVIPNPSPIIPAPSPVIPAKAGIPPATPSSPPSVSPAKTGPPSGPRR